jgi:heme A synthase
VPVKINGLPAHVLLIHLVVVLLPMAAAMLVASAVWPAARAKLGFLTPGVALVALVLVPVTTNAGEWLEDHLPGARTNPQVRRHAELGDQLLPWAIGIFLMAAVVWLLGRRFDLSWRRSSTAGTARGLPVWATVVVAVLAVAVSVGGVVQLYRIGDSGARAVWAGQV